MKRIAEQFRLDGAVQSVATLGEGFINDTYIITTERARYVLQRKNRNVFTDIPAMMRNIMAFQPEIDQYPPAEG